MTKCTFCFDNIDAGLPPACVAACPLRTLELTTEISRFARNDTVFPLPQSQLTQPALVIKPHKDTPRANEQSAQIANREEVGRTENREPSLVIFTLLSQMAVGAFCLLAALTMLGISLVKILYIPIPTMMTIAMLVSFGHLGSPLKAWRAFANLGSSWLSREILFATLFTGASALVALTQWVDLAPSAQTVFIGATALLGIALVVAMTNVYRLRTVEAWNNRTTLFAFFRATFLLGGLLVCALVALSENGIFALNPWLLNGSII